MDAAKDESTTVPSWLRNFDRPEPKPAPPPQAASASEGGDFTLPTGHVGEEEQDDD